MAIIVGLPLASLNDKPKKFFLYGSFTKPGGPKAIVISDGKPTTAQLAEAGKKLNAVAATQPKPAIGSNRGAPVPTAPKPAVGARPVKLYSQGTCWKDTSDPTKPVIVFSHRKTAENAAIRTACGGPAIVFKEPAPLLPGQSEEEENEDGNETDANPKGEKPDATQANGQGQANVLPVLRTSMPPVEKGPAERKAGLKGDFVAMQPSMVALSNLGVPVVKAAVLHNANGFTQSMSADNLDAAETHLNNITALIAEKLPANAPTRQRRMGVGLGGARIPTQQATETKPQTATTTSFQPTPIGQVAQTRPGINADPSLAKPEGSPMARNAQVIPPVQRGTENTVPQPQRATLDPDPSTAANQTSGNGTTATNGDAPDNTTPPDPQDQPSQVNQTTATTNATAPTNADAPTNNGIPTNPTPTTPYSTPIPPLKKPDPDEHYVPKMPDPPTLAWLRSVGTPRPPETNTRKKLNGDVIKRVNAQVNRGLFGGGVGKFKTVLQGVASMHEIQDLIEKERQKRPGQPLDAKTERDLLAKFDKVRDSLGKYQGKFDADGTATQYGRFSRQQGANDVRDQKLDFTNEVQRTLHYARAQFENRDLFARMDALGQKAATGNLSDAEEQRYNQLRAEFLLRADPDQPDVAATGSSTGVRLLHNPDGGIAYAFKTIGGESSQMGLEKGAGTAQEVLTSKLSDLLATTCGFNSGFPRTTLATLPVEQGGNADKNFGALIEGLPGRPLYESPSDITDFEKLFTNLSEEEKQALPARFIAAGLSGDVPTSNFDAGAKCDSLRSLEQRQEIRDLPPHTVQRILLMNLASVNMDPKWESVMFNGEDSRPFDGGGAIVGKDTAKKESERMRTADGELTYASGLLRIPGTNPTFKMRPDGQDFELDAEGKRTELFPAEMHPAAHLPLHDDFIAQMQGLNKKKIDEIQAAMTQEITNIGNSNPTMNGAVGAANLGPMIQSLTAMNEILTANPKLTTYEFLKAYNVRMKAYLDAA